MLIKWKMLLKIFIKKCGKPLDFYKLSLRVGIYKQVLHLFIKTITISRNLMTKYITWGYSKLLL